MTFTREQLMALSKEDLLFLDWQARWHATARPDQIPPETDWTEMGIQAGRGYGKQLCKETPIPTPSGWRRLGDLEVGDEVFDETGAPCRIVATYEQPVTRAYRLTFSDGATITACEDHLWVTFLAEDLGAIDYLPEGWAKLPAAKVRTTDEIVKTLFTADGKPNHRIPACRELKYADEGIDIGELWAFGFRLTDTADPIPSEYLQTSWEQRLYLLSGLSNRPNRGPGVVCKSETQAKSVLELVRSMGMVVAPIEAQNGEYTVRWGSIGDDLAAFHRMIVAAEEVAPAPMRCLTVDSPNSMFLCGEALIPTHNTRIGAEWLGKKAYRDTERLPHAVIAPTLNDVRFTCFEGHSGLLNVIPPELVEDYNKTNLQIKLINGVAIRGFSAEEPERLRGPQFAALWGDELAAWSRDEETWDMAMFGLRLGRHPQVMWTSTPKPKTLIRKLTEPKPGRIIVRGSTYDNRENLAPSFFEALKKYEGTKLGRQELEGELIDAEEGGIIARSWFKMWPASKPLPKFEWIIMSLDTAFTERTLNKRTHDPDPSACAVFGIFWHEDVMNVLVLDCWSDHLGMPDLITRVKRELNVAYGDDEDTSLIKPMFGPSKPMTSGRKPDLLVIEDKGSGISLRQSLSKEGIHAYPYNPGRADKLARLHMVSHLFARGYFWLPESEKRPGKPRTWTEPALDQLCSFRGGGSIKHDDFVDVFSQAARVIMDKGLLSGVKRESKSVREAPAPPKTRVNPYAI
ncbi:MAG: hypothetical protein IOB84_14740 [Brevundimonas sp.]|nr:hypothetical protein [Brevundimonas sp.]